MKSQSEVEQQIKEIKTHIEKVTDDAPELIWCRGRLQALKWVLKK